MTGIKVEQLQFGYGSTQILKGIDVSFDKPELVCVLGPNGVGKTTLVKCINKLLKPTSGRICVDGENVSDIKLLDLAKKMAFVPNSSTNVFSMSITEAVLMGRHPHSGWTTTEEDLDIVERAIDMMGLKDLAARNINELSAGQHQRVMLARGLAQDPQVLILDEPTSNLDVKFQMGVMKFLKQYAREKNVIVIMVCHDLNLTAAYADRVVLLYDGRIYADGSVRDVLTEENIKHVYDVEADVIDVGGSPYIILLPE